MSEWPQHYILLDRLPVAVDFMTWAQWFEDIANRRIAWDMIGPVTVSTVFLGLDHNFGRGEPLLFETLISGGPFEGDIRRYHTYSEAEKGHAIALNDASKAAAAIRDIAEQAGAKPCT